MNASIDLERRLADYYASAPLRAPDRVLAATLATIDTTPQRRALLRLPWRFQNMNRFAGLAVAAVAALAVGALALAVLLGGRPPSVGSDPSPSHGGSLSPSPSARAGVVSPMPTGVPDLTETFTSTIHGASISHPAGWTTIPATLPWDGTAFPLMDSGTADIIYEKEDDSPFIALASHPLGGGAGDAWVAEQVSSFTDKCAAATESVTIDGRPGAIVGACPSADGGRPILAVAAVGDRGYLIYLYGIDDLAWLRAIVATARLEPALAVDPVDGSEFRHPFTVWMPPGEGWDAAAVGDVYAEFRIPGSGPDGNSSAVGVILRAIDGGRADPCDPSSDPVALGSGPQAPIDYLDSLARLTVVSPTPTTIAGMGAVQAEIQVAEPTSECPELYPFAEQDGFQDMEVVNALVASLRVAALETDGEHVIVWTFLTVSDTSWLDVADQLIEAIDFETP